MRKFWNIIFAGSVLVLASRAALADDDTGIGFSIAVPGASIYAEPAPAYYPPWAYAAPPTAYVDAPPAYYYAPQQGYYDDAPPAVSVYYGPSGDEYRGQRWRENDEEHHGHRDWGRRGGDE